MAPLGLGAGLIYQGNVSDAPAVVIEDYYWMLHPTAGAGYLTPYALGDVISAIHDTWEVITIDSTAGNYQPRTTATVSDEGYWDIGSPASASDPDYIRPLDV